MNNLGSFIIKHHFVILFILLEVISILLLARSQNFHRNRLVNTTNDAVGKVYEWSSEVGNYFRLNTANKQLAEENAMLRKQLSVVYDTTSCTYDILNGDTLDVTIVKEGREQGQGIAYLEDGTMIVVEDGKKFIGQTINVAVTSVLQTSAGRMIFVKPAPII